MPDVMRQCVRPACTFRFPGPDITEFPCPKCGSPTLITDLIPNTSPNRKDQQKNTRLHLEVGLDNLRSVFNVGSIFRTADAVGINHIHLFGTTPPPTHPKMNKTALGAVMTIPWSQHWDGLSAIRKLKDLGYLIWCLEYSPGSENLLSSPIPDLQRSHFLVVGNEKNGIDPQIMAIADYNVFLPMVGEKESLNVASAFAVAVYWFQFFRGMND